MTAPEKAQPATSDVLLDQALMRLERERERDALYGADDLPGEFDAVRNDVRCRAQEEDELAAVVGLPQRTPPPRFSKRFQRPWRLLGQGGLGAVFSVLDDTLRRRVAIKVIRRDYEALEEARRRFGREARLCAGLTHPGIIPVHELLEDDDKRLCLVMKLVEGVTLAAWLGEKRSELEKLAAFEAMCAAMDSAHRQGVIHRDLKPLNIMVGPFSEIYVMDWGLACELGTPAPQPADPTGSTVNGEVPAGLTLPGEFIGTQAYASPEQIRGDWPLDARADVYSLGVVFGEMLAGGRPDPQPGGADVMAELGSHRDARLARIALDCMGRLETRPADAGEILARLKAYREAVAQDAKDRQKAERDKERAEARASRLRGWVTAVGVALACLLAIGAGAWAWHSRDQKRRADDALAGSRAIDAGTQAMDRAEAVLGERRADDAEPLLKQAGLALAVAEDAAHAAPGGSLEKATARLGERLRMAQRVRALVAALAEADARSAARIYAFGPDPQPIASGYKAAFAEWGLHPLSEAVGDTVGKLADIDPLARSHLAEALLPWIGAQPKENRLSAVATHVLDSPPDILVREALRSGDAAKLLAAAAANNSKPRRLWFLGQALVMAKARPEALALYRRALIDHPRDRWLHLGMGNALLDAKPQDFREIEGCWRAALASDPRCVVAWCNLGSLLAASGRRSDAEKCYRQAKALHAENDLLLLNEAALALSDNDPDRANRMLAELGRRYPGWNPVAAMAGMARVLLETFPTPQTVALVERVAKELPGNWVAGYALGVLRLKQARIDEAAEAFKAVRQDLPARVGQDMVAFQNYLVLARQGRFPEALARLEKALRAQKAGSPFRVLFACLRAEALGYLGRPEEARSALAALKLGPGEQPIHDAVMVELLAAQGKFAECVAYWSAAARKNPAFGQAQPVKRGVCGQMAKALDGFPPKGKWPGEEILSDFFAGLKAEAAFWSGRPWWSYLAYHWLLEKDAGKRFVLAQQRCHVLNDDAAYLTPVALAGRAAVRASASAMEGGRRFSAKERAAARRQGLAWLKAELAQQKQWANVESYRGGSRFFVLTMRTAPDLAALRDPDALARLPEEDWSGWVAFWEDLAAFDAKLHALK